MKRTLAAIFLIVILNTAPASANTPTATSAPPGAWPQTAVTFGDGVALVRQTKEPRPCAPDYDGRLSMTAQGEICICDGTAKLWRLANTDKSCTWNTAP